MKKKEKPKHPPTTYCVNCHKMSSGHLMVCPRCGSVFVTHSGG